MSLLNIQISLIESGPNGHERTRIIVGQVNRVTCLVDFLRYFCKFYLLWEFLNFCTQKQIEGFAKDYIGFLIFSTWSPNLARVSENRANIKGGRNETNMELSGF